MRWIIAIVLAAIFWALSAQPFIDTANHVQLIEQLGLNLRTALVQMGAVVLMFPVLDTFFLTPLREAMQSRNQQLEATYTEAEQLRARMEAMKTEYEARLAATEASAREQIQAQIKEATNLRTELIAEANSKRDEMLKKATEEIAYEKTRVISEIRSEVVNLTLMATERVLGENVDNDRNRKLVQEFIDKVEVPG